LPVDAQPLQGRGLAAEFGLGEVDRADWPGAHRRLLLMLEDVAVVDADLRPHDTGRQVGPRAPMVVK
jgi:hypothetical protein